MVSGSVTGCVGVGRRGVVQDNPGDWAGPERQCWSRLGSSMQKQETSISQLASGAAPGCFPRRSPPALWGSYRGRGSLESFMRAGLGIGLPVSHQATGDAPSSDTAAWGPWGGGLLAGQPWRGGSRGSGGGTQQLLRTMGLARRGQDTSVTPTQCIYWNHL